MTRLVRWGVLPFLSAACIAAQPANKGGEMIRAVAATTEQALAPLDLAGNDAARYRAENEARLQLARAQLAALEHAPQPADHAAAPHGQKSAQTADDVLAQLNALMQQMDRATSHAGLMRNVHPNAAMREAADKAEQAWSQLATDIGLSSPLYQKLMALDSAGLSATAKRYLAHTLRDFRRSGVDRDAQTRQQIRLLKEELVQIGQAFDQHIREDVRTVAFEAQALRGLPADYVAAHAPDAQHKVHVSTHYPDYIPFMSYAHDDGARQALYTAFRQRGFPKNEPVLRRLLHKRFLLAKALGFASWADYITADKMVGSAQAAQAFIDKVAELAVARGHKDKEALLFALRQSDPGAQEVRDWQKAYLEEQERRARYQLDSQVLRSYFRFAKVRDGIFAATGKMFNVRYQRVEATAWHQDVEAYDLYQQNERIGRFYLDLHPRADKYQHAAAFPIQAGFVAGAITQLPIAALVCNFPQGDDALLEHDDVTTFFHEFGHLLHHLFAGKGRFVGQSGIATEWDFVEAPSQMLEEWSFAGEVLRLFAYNARGEALPDALVQALRRSRNLGRGIWVQQQMFYAALSLGYHHQDPTGPLLATSDTLVQQLQARYAPFAHVPNTHFQLSFGHLEGYSAMYYTYMWSLVIAKDLFGAFQKAPSLLQTEVASRYRDKVLAPGGSKDAAELVADFLGRPTSFDAFAAWVNADD